MTGVATIIAALSAIAWAWLLLARGSFWRCRKAPLSLTRNTHPAGAEEQASDPKYRSLSERVVAVVPARNEEEFIGRSVGSLLAAGIRVVVVDDHSSDKTVAVARAAAAALQQRQSPGASAGQRLTVIAAKPLPAGWSGKLWALNQGIEEALSPPSKSNNGACREPRTENLGADSAGPISLPEFLLLTDADIAHTPETIRRLLEIADSGYDLVSFMVKLECRTLPERLLLPAFVFFFFMLYPPAWVSDPRHRTAGAAGGCILIRPAALARAGGLEAIRDEIIDDCALASAVKRSGGRLWLSLTESSASLRPYESLAEIGRMISRTAFKQLRHSAWLLLATLLGLGIVYLAPPVLLFSAGGTAAALAGSAWAAMALAYLPMIGFYGLSPLWAFGLPLAAAFYAGATVYSALLYWSGRGGRWKGRVQDAPGSGSGASSGTRTSL